MTDKIGIGVIGLGHWGKHYVRIFDWVMPDAHVVQAADLDHGNLEAIRSHHPLVNVTTSEAEVVQHPQVDAVVIATPASDHHRIAMRALAAGKHVLVEKPLTIDPAQSVALGEAARKAGRVLLVGHTFLYNPAVRLMKQAMSAPAFGDVYYLSARRNNLGPIREDVDAVGDLAPHDVSIFNYLLDAEPLRASALGGRFLREDRADVAFVNLEYPRGVVASIQVSWVDAHKVREVVAIGSRQRIVFDDLDAMAPLRIVDKGIAVDRGASSFGEFRYQVRDGDIRCPHVEPAEPLRVLCRHFLDCVHGDARPMTGADAGAAVVKAIAAIGRSLERGGAPVEVTEVEPVTPARPSASSARSARDGGQQRDDGRDRAVARP